MKLKNILLTLIIIVGFFVVLPRVSLVSACTKDSQCGPGWSCIGYIKGPPEVFGQCEQIGCFINRYVVQLKQSE